ncbi:MAG TPA: MarR family transcriptional regulator, partial [Caulobacteraceae bacterium]|nr:MarR family transcriptional regulator [Caulobacteraceae bacterium]
MPAKKRATADLGLMERERADALARGPSGPPEKWGMIYLLARIFYAMRQQSEDALKPHNLTPMQFTILSSLKRWDGMSSAELSRRFGVTPQTMGEMIGNLERRALVARVQDPANRRALRLSLTPAGEKLFNACEAAMQAVEAEMFEQMSSRDLEALRG